MSYFGKEDRPYTSIKSKSTQLSKINYDLTNRFYTIEGIVVATSKYHSGYCLHVSDLSMIPENNRNEDNIFESSGFGPHNVIKCLYFNDKHSKMVEAIETFNLSAHFDALQPIELLFPTIDDYRIMAKPFIHVRITGRFGTSAKFTNLYINKAQFITANDITDKIIKVRVKHYWSRKNKNEIENGANTTTSSSIIGSSSSPSSKPSPSTAGSSSGPSSKPSSSNAGPSSTQPNPSSHLTHADSHQDNMILNLDDITDAEEDDPSSQYDHKFVESNQETEISSKKEQPLHSSPHESQDKLDIHHSDFDADHSDLDTIQFTSTQRIIESSSSIFDTTQITSTQSMASSNNSLVTSESQSKKLKTHHAEDPMDLNGSTEIINIKSYFPQNIKHIVSTADNGDFKFSPMIFQVVIRGKLNYVVFDADQTKSMLMGSLVNNLTMNYMKFWIQNLPKLIGSSKMVKLISRNVNGISELTLKNTNLMG